MQFPDYESVKPWFSENRNWLFFVFVVAILAFPAELFHFSLTMDEELTETFLSPQGWIEQGRWGQYLLSFIFSPNPVLPFTPLFLSLMLSAVACTIIVRVWSQQRSIADYLVAPILIACPTLYYVYQFNTLNFGIGFGQVLSAIAIYLFVYNKGGRRLLAIPFACFAIGIYQAFVPYLAVLYGVYLLGCILKGDSRSVWQYILLTVGFGLVLVFALALNSVILKVIYATTDITPSSYLSLWIRVEANIAYLLKTLVMIKVEMSRYYFGDSMIYGNAILPLKFLFILCSIFSLIAIACVKQSLLIRLFALLVFLSVLLFPFALHLMNGGFMPIRAMPAFPLALAGLVFVASHINQAKLNAVLIVLVLLVFFRFSVVNNQMAYANQLSSQADRELTTRLMTRLDSLGLSRLEGDEARPLMLVGYQKRKESVLMIQGQDHYDTMGASFYDWQGGNTKRVIGLMKIMGIDYFREASLKEQRAVLEQAEAMPIWPAQGSVFEYEGVTVIKLGNFHASQLFTFIGNEKACHRDHSSVGACRVLGSWHPNNHPRHDGIIIQNLKDDDNKMGEHLVDINTDSQGFLLEHASVEKNTADNGSLIRGQGNKTLITFPALEIGHKQKVALIFQITVPEISSFVLHYRYENEADFSDKHKAVYYLDKGENSLSLLIPGELMRQGIRLTPSTKEGEFTISRLSLSQAIEQ